MLRRLLPHVRRLHPHVQLGEGASCGPGVAPAVPFRPNFLCRLVLKWTRFSGLDGLVFESWGASPPSPSPSPGNGRQSASSSGTRLGASGGGRTILHSAGYQRGVVCCVCCPEWSGVVKAESAVQPGSFFPPLPCPPPPITRQIIIPAFL